MDLFGEEPKVEAKEESADKAADPFFDADFNGSPEYEHHGLKPPRQNAFCFGHDGVEGEILKLYNNKRMPHGLIFSGPMGIGKSTFAFRLARFLLSRTEVDPNQDALFGGDDLHTGRADTLLVEPENTVFSRVSSGGHSDLLTVGRLMDDKKGSIKASVEVAEVRKVAPFLRKTAAEADWRVVIIDDADTMNINAQNALLKILEEPPENTVLILVTHRIGALIPTIRSRTQVLHFKPLSPEHLRQLLVLQGHALSEQEFAALYTLCDGSIGQALDLIENGGLDVMSKIVMMFENYPRWKWSEIHLLAEDMARAGANNSYDMFEKVMQWMADNLTRAKARNAELPGGPLSMDVFEDIKNKLSLEELVKICENLKQHFESVRRSNLEKRQAVLQAFSYFGA